MKYLILLLITTGSIQSFAQQSAVFYKVSGKNMPAPSYIFGTFPDSDASTFKVSDSVFIAFNNSPIIVTENILNGERREQTLDAMRMPDNIKLTGLLNNFKFGAVNEQMIRRYGSELWRFEDITPLYIMDILQQVNDPRAQTFEEFLISMHQMTDKKLSTYYSAEELRNIYKKIPLPVQSELLMDYIVFLQNQNDNNPLLPAYLSENSYQLNFLTLSNRYYEYNRLVLEEKTKLIQKGVLHQLKEQPAFFMLDVVYLPGENGIISKLKAEGYQVNPLRVGFNDQAHLSSNRRNRNPSKVEPPARVQFLVEHENFDESHFNEVIPHWRKIQSHQGAFEVRMPLTPDYITEKIQENKDLINVHIFRFEDRAINSFYMVSYMDYPKGFRESHRNDFFREIISNMVIRMGGRLLKEHNISTSTYSGREVEVAMGNDYIAKARFFLTGNRLYQVIVGGSGQRVYNTQNQAFLNSFRVVDQQNQFWHSLHLGSVQLEMPDQPKRELVIDPYKNESEIWSLAYSASESNSGIEARVKVTYYPLEFEVKSKNTFYKSVIFTAANKTNSIIISDEDIRVGKVKGRLVTFGSEGDKIYRGMLFYHEGKLYQAWITGTEDAIYSYYGERFINSFQFGKYEY